MHWLIQGNLIKESDAKRIVDALKAEGSSFSRIKVKPFTDRIRMPYKQTVKPGDAVVALGSTTLCQVIRDKKLFRPGVWWNENFNFETQRDWYGELMLNHDAEVHAFRDIPSFQGTRFIRPVDDGKLFSGEVIHSMQFDSWRERALDYQTGNLLDARVMVSTVKDVRLEYRFFVVDGTVVTGSQYSVKGKFAERALDPFNGYDQKAINFAKLMMDCPNKIDECYVMDIALVDDVHEPYIVEFNCLNGSGVYLSDVRKLVRAIETFVVKKYANVSPVQVVP